MAGNYVLLETIQLTQDASSVTFDNIPQTGYTDLKIVASARSNRGAYEDSFNVRVGNGTVDSGSNYGYNAFYEYDNSNFTSDLALAQTAMSWQSPASAAQAGANIFGNSDLYISNYTSSVGKSFSCDSASENNASQQLLGFTAGYWSGTSAINIITMSPRSGTLFYAGSTFSLYGIAALGTEPVVAPMATGGNIIANDGTYWYHAFLSSGTFTPHTTLSCDYLVVAGGGSGGMGSSGGSYSGGGGAGGMRSTVTATGGGGSLESTVSVAAQAYAITVGAGGAAVTTAAVGGNSGTNSTFSTITATGGGGGGSFNDAAKSGGSGGGGGEAGGGAAGAGTPGQGYAGGVYAGNGYAGGGGGAGSIGASTTPNPSNGGSGVATSITGTSTTYAAGGRGGVVATVNGTANTGNGGDGKAGSTGTSGAGGSGIVIIRYAMA